VGDSFRIVPLGDQSLLVEFGRHPDPLIHRRVVSLHRYLNQEPFPGFLESVPAYTSLTIFFNPLSSGLIAYRGEQPLIERIRTFIHHAIHSASPADISKEIVRIPVCYDISFGPDLPGVARFCGLSMEEVISLHTGTVYRLYMIGFVPGFPYLGMTDVRLEVPRKQVPSPQIPAGSVAIAGRQTGIYPQQGPGGWHVIGRTPFRLFRPENSEPFPLEPGMEVVFERVDTATFEKMTGR